jgi:hypothetical protein
MAYETVQAQVKKLMEDFEEDKHEFKTLKVIDRATVGLVMSVRAKLLGEVLHIQLLC